LDLYSLFTLTLLAASSAFTPGPNNALVAASGVNFGYRRTLPHIFGIALGFAVMIFIIGLFLGQLFQQSAVLRELLRWAGVLLLLYVAYKIATAGGLTDSGGQSRPFRFIEAAGFQWINPKAWAMASAITAQFIDPMATVKTALIISAVFVVTGLFSASAWTFLGQWLSQFLNSPERQALFNKVMGTLVAACVFGLVFE